MISSVSVIICAYTEQRWEDLLKAVASLATQHPHPLEIIVVIDHNPALFRRAQAALPQAKVVENLQERGLSGARNSGIAVATGAILAFMDEDAHAAPDWLNHLLAAYTDERVMGVGGAIVPQWDGGRPAWFPPEFDWVVGCTYRGLPTTAAPVRNLIGCNMSFRRTVIEQVGGFRSGIGRIGALPVGCEETEYCIRAQTINPTGQFIFEPAALVYHRVPVERGRWRYFRRRCYFEGRSKALVTALTGAGKGLSAERAYTTRVLPSGVVRGLLDGLTGRDSAGPLRALAIAAGLLTTVAGYGVGKVRLPRPGQQPRPHRATHPQAAN
jgi:GT2 family glycosyltransferase